MKTRLLSLICLLVSMQFMQAQVKNAHTKVSNGINIRMVGGTLGLYPLHDNTVRVQFFSDTLREKRELILKATEKTPKFSVVESNAGIRMSLKNMHIDVDKATGSIQFINLDGVTFLKEKVGSRQLTPSSVQGEPCFLAQQAFESPKDELILGLGQFQDGAFNLRNFTRKLTQVNTQIAIPFYYSNKGYGLLWHQYGLTDFNPTTNNIPLEKQAQATPGSANMVEVTTTSGTQRVSQNQSLYLGSFQVPTDGQYSIFLDLGDMGNRHFVVIDGKPCMDQSNQWLPPTSGAIVDLKAGTHQVQVLCKSNNNPNLSWKRCSDETVLRSPNAKSLDYVVFYGPSADKVIATYRDLTGEVPLFPLWAYGFWQCRERYTSGTHLVETVKEFRKRNLPMDVIVQDWQYWGKYGWGVPKFDEANYPNPEKFIKELHDLNARFSISVWENLDKNSVVAKDYIAKNLYIPNSPWIDIYNPETQKTHWNALNTNLFVHGVDSWWMDATEPENDALKGKNTYYGLGDFYRLTYPLLVSKAVYEGQRETDPSKRVCILTRSAFSGQQQYGVINWSGDIGGTWDAYKRQVVAGLNFTMTGLPYWTTDIGGFFRPGRSQYTDEKFHELLTRWFQWGALNPIFRSHGYGTETEPWKFGTTVENNVRTILNIRYRLMPYIYSEAWLVTNHGSTMMRPLVMDFNQDSKAIEQPYQYMFGKSLLVAPIIEAGHSTWDVYLPKTTSWYDFWTGKKYTGGQTVNTPAPLDQMPLYVRAGSILPIGNEMQYTGEKAAETLEIRIFKGANGSFELYEDEGDNYNYEQGKYATIRFTWDDKNQQLSIDKRLGSFEKMLKTRVFNLVLVSENNGVGIQFSKQNKSIVYTGKAIKVKL